MITTTNLAQLRLLEYYEAMTLLYGDMSKLTIEEEKVTQALNNFKSRLDKFDEALILIRGSELTPELEDLDAKRDAAFVSLVNQLRALMKSPVDELSGAATTLYRLIERYGKDIHRQAYMQESGHLINLLQDLANSPYAALVETAGVQKSVDILKTTNETFDHTYADRLSEAVNKNKNLAKTERRNLQTCFENLCQLIDSGLTWTGEAIYQQMTDVINTHVENARQKVLQRLAVKKGWENRNTTSGTESPTPEPAE